MRPTHQQVLDALERAQVNLAELQRRQRDGHAIDERALAKGLLILHQLERWLDGVDQRSECLN